MVQLQGRTEGLSLPHVCACVCPPTVQQRACFDRMETLHCHTSAYKAGELMDG